MLAGTPWIWWLGFHGAVVVLLVVDARLPRHILTSRTRARPQSVRIAWLWTGVLTLAAAGFAAWIGVVRGREVMLQFAAGYLVEFSLSIDNLFVFLILFESLKVGVVRQHQALRWGVGGAVVMRAVFIASGLALLHRFHPITWIFGGFLLYTAWRLLRGRSTREALPSWIQSLNFSAGTLLPLILAVEFTDVLFAVDSIPAVLAISRNLFVVYTSNIAAVLGLRSLYFALADAMDSFRFLHFCLGALLGFIAIKMLIEPWVQVPTMLSLGVMSLILAFWAAASWVASRHLSDSKAPANPQEAKDPAPADREG